jgi:RNA polymerase sigma factor (sigma-70 family)
MSALLTLDALRNLDNDAWDQANHWLFPIAVTAADSKLHGSLASDAEDIAMEALADLHESVDTVTSVEDLPKVVTAIAYCRAADHIRRHTSQKRGSGKVESLDEPRDEEGGGVREIPDRTDPLAAISVRELPFLLAGVMANISSRTRAMLEDWYLHGKKAAELAAKYGMSEASIHKTLSRGLDQIGLDLKRRPKLAGELREALQIAARNLSILLCLV